MQYYPQYRLEDFYKKHYWQGGITLNQTKILYEQALLRELDSRKFQASIHGIDLNDKEQNKASEQSTDNYKIVPSQKNQSLPIFQDPKEYEHLSTEEKEKLTQKMIGKHRKWAKKAM